MVTFFALLAARRKERDHAVVLPRHKLHCKQFLLVESTVKIGLREHHTRAERTPHSLWCSTSTGYASSMVPRICRKNGSRSMLAHLKKGRHVLCLCEAATGLSSKMCRQAIRMSISTGIGHARKHELLAAKTTIFVRSLHTQHGRPHSSIQPIYSRHAPA